jgi:succinate dehydrogenase/fumarate reductase flavoprotein subunit
MSAQTFDVIVVGGGGAGLAAAIEAAEAGARVALLEKNERLGGSTAWSIGSVTATQTAHQRKRGIVDAPAAHWIDMPAFAGDLQLRDNDPLRRILCDAMPQTFQWLLDSGVCFYGPMPEPPHSQPRMHNVLPNSRAFIYHLERRARKAGVQIRLDARVQALDVDDAGRVCGVVVGMGERRTHLQATGDVVLAAGDFTNDPVLKARFMGEQEAKVDGVNPTATGDGQHLAEALGAQIVNGDLALGPELRFIAPGIAYAYLDDYRRNRADVFTAAGSVRALAARLGMAPDGLEQACAAIDNDRPALVEPPFIALGPLRSVFVHAEGGVRVDEQHRVLDARGAPIEGLRAAGSTGQGGLLLKGHGHHLAWAFASGRRAGRFAAEVARSRRPLREDAVP